MHRRLLHAPGRIRTCDFCLRRAALYPLSYGRPRAILRPWPSNRATPIAVMLCRWSSPSSPTPTCRAGRGGLPDACVERIAAADLILHAGDVIERRDAARARGHRPARGRGARQRGRRRAARRPSGRARSWRPRGRGSRWSTTPARAQGRFERLRRASGDAPTPWSSATPTSRSTRSTTASRSSTRAAPPSAAARPTTRWAMAHGGDGRGALRARGPRLTAVRAEAR